MFVLQTPLGFVSNVIGPKSDSLPALFSRFLTTLNHVIEWTESDLLDPTTKAHQSITHVRAVHQRLYDRLNRVGTGDAIQDKEWVSQHAMTVTEWAFVGLLFMHPRENCIHGTDEQVLKVLTDINYLWRCIGYMIGIADENNLCRESVEETIALSHAVFEKTFKPVIDVSEFWNPLAYQMGIDSLAVLSPIAPGVTGEVILTFWSRVFGFKMPYIRPLTLTESLAYYALSFGHRYLDGTWIRGWHRDQVRKVIVQMNENKEAIIKDMRKRHPESKYAADGAALTSCGLSSDLISQICGSVSQTKVSSGVRASDRCFNAGGA